MNQGELLTKIRDQYGYSQARMAKELGVSKSYYNMIENGNRSISKNVAIKLHKKFGIALETLIDDNRRS